MQLPSIEMAIAAGVLRAGDRLCLFAHARKPHKSVAETKLKSNGRAATGQTIVMWVASQGVVPKRAARVLDHVRVLAPGAAGGGVALSCMLARAWGTAPPAYDAARERPPREIKWWTAWRQGYADPDGTPFRAHPAALDGYQYQIDHVTPLALVVDSSPNNIRALSADAHYAKSLTELCFGIRDAARAAAPKSLAAAVAAARRAEADAAAANPEPPRVMTRAAAALVAAGCARCRVRIQGAWREAIVKANRGRGSVRVHTLDGTRVVGWDALQVRGVKHEEFA